ncbi:winged helix-turn-helix transcriptional regulator [Methanolobus zinderi]|uniref:Winged helix-turn-helix transcriptional regulator n=1 Tax=Methanolobus zinderi TaxID=536044 RepID=A0A7D5E987_9EURY|nr:metalloregulator ArsR/SmtB family transcription factor [Methanolobus zinderi]QLC50979.1 winged helix-turn-helix transcriptional regulator [Methanolobus zinderi]
MEESREHTCVDEKTIFSKKAGIPSEEELCRICDILSALHSETRLKILFLLSEGGLCVKELEMALDISQSAISHSLRTLRQLNLVKSRKEGRFAVYHLSDEHVGTFLDMCRQHVGECK